MRLSARPLMVVLGFVVAGSVLSGCSAESAPASTTALVDPQTKRLGAVVACMEQHGWKSSVSWNRSILTTDIPDGQQSAESAVEDGCVKNANAEFPLPTFDLTSEKAEYQKELANRACFVKLGYAMPQPPSLQAYLDEFKTSPWKAYSDVPVGPEATYKKAMETCWPPSWSE